MKPELSSAANSVIALFGELVSKGVGADEAARTAAATLAATPEGLLTPAEFAARVGRDEKTVRRWGLERKVRCVVVGGQVVGFHWQTFLSDSLGQPRKGTR